MMLNNKFQRPPAKTEKSLKPDEFQSFRAFVSLMNELTKVMAEENKLVETRKFPQQKALVFKKQRMSMDYRAGMKALASQPELIKKLPQELRDAMRMASLKLSEAATVNAQLLRTAILGTQRLLQSVITVVKDERLPKGGYKDTRKGKGSLGSYSPTCKPVSVTRMA